MRIKENEFKIGNYIFTGYSYDGGFGRGAEIYEIVGLTAKSIKVKKVCEKTSCDCGNGEELFIYKDSEVKTLRIKDKSNYKYVTFSKDHAAGTKDQFTDFSDIIDNGCYYQFKK